MTRFVIVALLLGVVACAKGGAKPRPRTVSTDPHHIVIAVTEKGFEPDHITVKQGEDTTLIFSRETDQTCAKEVVIALGGTDSVRRDLPLHQDVPITVRFPKAGELRYACGMDMVSGVITVQ